jgi:hypothetical protein
VPHCRSRFPTVSAIKIHHTFDFDSRKAFVEKSSRQR